MASMQVVAVCIVVHEWIEHKMLYTAIGRVALFEQTVAFARSGLASGNRSYFVNSLHKPVCYGHSPWICKFHTS